MTDAQTETRPQKAAAIAFDDFIKMDLRIATVTGCEPHPNADRLLKVQLDDGTPGGRQVCAGIKQWYAPEEMIGRQVVIVANLEPRKIRGEISEGMILAASDVHETDDAGEPTERDVVVIQPGRAVAPGSRVS